MRRVFLNEERKHIFNEKLQTMSDVDHQSADTSSTESVREVRQGPLPKWAAERKPAMSSESSGLDVWVERNLNPIPTGFYHLMDARAGEFIAEQMLRAMGEEACATDDSEPQKPWGECFDPVSFVQVCVKNRSKKTRQLIVHCYVEGLSDEAVETIEVPPKKWVVVDLKPTLKEECVERLDQTRQASMHVLLERPNGSLEGHKTLRVTCLSRNAAIFEMHGGGHELDLSWCYGAWVTPHEDSVQDQIRKAFECSNLRGMTGYCFRNRVDAQVEALFNSLKTLGVKYVNSNLNFGVPEGTGYSTRVRLPRESLEQRSANCMDATLLLASLLEGVSLNPAIVLIPGHAMLGWERWPAEDKLPQQDWSNWRVLEATAIGLNFTFEQACAEGHRKFMSHYNLAEPYEAQKVTVWSLRDLRKRGVWPLE